MLTKRLGATKTPTILATVLTCAVMVPICQFGGAWLGTEVAKLEESGVYGTTWLMSQAEVRSIAPNAVVSGNELHEIRQLYGREVKVRYVFENDKLVGAVATFNDEGSQGTYDAMQRQLETEYGAMPTPSMVDGQLTSEKIIGRLGVKHIMSRFLIVHVEHVAYYRTER